MVRPPLLLALCPFSVERPPVCDTVRKQARTKSETTTKITGFAAEAETETEAAAGPVARDLTSLSFASAILLVLL